MSLLLDLIFPRFCYSCGRPGRYLCLRCQSKLVVRSVRPPQRLPLFRYRDPIKTMIHDLKFNFVSDLVPEFALLISRTLKTKFPHLLDYWQQENFVLVPIPLHSYRQNWRGFNQSELILKELAPLINLKTESVIVRTKNSLPQTKIKDKALRHTNISSAFNIVNKNYKNIILFDDVYTTGSTTKSAISCLPQDANVWILTIA